MKGAKKTAQKSTGQLDQQDIDTIRDLYEFMCHEGLVDLEINQPHLKLSIKRYRENNSPHPYSTAMPAPELTRDNNPETEKKEHSTPGPQINSPLIGVFYRASSPTTDSFVREGDHVAAGSVLCIIEAMKVMNEIHAEKSCCIKKILIENGCQVMAGQALFDIELD